MCIIATERGFEMNVIFRPDKGKKNIVLFATKSKVFAVSSILVAILLLLAMFSAIYIGLTLGRVGAVGAFLLLVFWVDNRDPYVPK
jgi:hypothetical protein